MSCNNIHMRAKSHMIPHPPITGISLKILNQLKFRRGQWVKKGSLCFYSSISVCIKVPIWKCRCIKKNKKTNMECIWELFLTTIYRHESVPIRYAPEWWSQYRAKITKYWRLWNTNAIQISPYMTALWSRRITGFTLIYTIHKVH